MNRFDEEERRRQQMELWRISVVVYIVRTAEFLITFESVPAELWVRPPAEKRAGA
jgi:hypothetical protein